MLKNLMKTVKGRMHPTPSDRFPLATAWPSLDLDESDKEVRVKVEAPGLSEKDLRVTYADGILSIEGEKREEREERRKGVLEVAIPKRAGAGAGRKLIPVD